MPSTFAQALIAGDVSSLRTFPKADRHCHSIFGARIEALEAWAGRPIERAPDKMPGLPGMSQYIASVLNPLTDNQQGVEFTARTAVSDAAADGVILLEVSIGSRFARYFTAGVPAFAAFVERLVAEAPAGIEVSPELGVIRQDVLNPGELANVHAAIESGAFHGIDLYGAEDGCTPEQARDLFGQARAAGLRAKAHVGEFGTDAEAVRRTVATLTLDAVQHGIAAASSPEVMRWLADRGTLLNVCPSSNVALGAVERLRDHPIRALHQHGVRVTVNTDDLTIFGRSVSDEYLGLFRESVLDAETLDAIRRRSLGRP